MANWFSLGASGLSALGGFASAAMANASSGKAFGRQLYAMQRQAELNYEYGQKSALNSPSWNRKGLENAGFNPMLAVQNGTTGSNSAWTSQGSAPMADLSGAYASGVANAQSVQRLKNETDVADSQSDTNYATADKSKAEKAAIIEELPYIGKNSKAKYMKTEMESAKLENDIHYQNEYLNYLENSLKLNEKLGLMGLDVKKYGIDVGAAASRFASQMSYNASTYASNVNEHNNIRTNRVNTSLEHIRHPYASLFHKGYTSGKDYSPSYRDPWH